MSSGSDLELLRRYEPILRFTQGEMFFPAPVEPYVSRCSLWARSGEDPVQLFAPGDLDIDSLAATGPPAPGTSQWLQFVEEPLSGRVLVEWKAQARAEFRAPGRLARVGLLARFVDGLFTLSLYLRGTVPGGTAAGAEMRYREMFREAPGYVYYGRVVRDGGYVALQYLFFYAMNDWRSSFYGVNDHEADWEQIFVYLESTTDGDLQPAWVAYAAHDAAGDDLRRHWDDPELRREGDHPVVFVGAGSHASYFIPGEYLVEVPLRPLRRVIEVLGRVEYVWRNILRQGAPRGGDVVAERFFRVPFVDYARGDGKSVGPGCDTAWTPVCIDDDTPWVRNFRGLWGLDVRDIFAGELAPAGPRYTRDGTVRESWRDPLGWSGLRKVAAEGDAAQLLEEQIAALEKEVASVNATITEMDEALPRLELEVRALWRSAHLRDVAERRQMELSELEAERLELGRRHSELRDTLEQCRSLRDEPPERRRGDVRSHIRHAHVPETPNERRRNIAAEIWAAVSTGILLVGAVVLLFAGVDDVLVPIAVFVAVVIGIESLFRRTLTRLLIKVVLGLTVATALVLLYEFSWEIILAVVALIGLLIIFDNIRELRGR